MQRKKVFKTNPVGFVHTIIYANNSHKLQFGPGIKKES